MNAAIQPEVWRHAFPAPGTAVPTVRRMEELGFDGVLLADSQNLEGDVYAELALAAAATDRVLLGTGVTNPLTRHPAVTASAIATVQVESRGRAVLGVGRGDSSLGQIGHRPAAVEVLERHLEQVQGYLRGEAVDMNGFPSRIAWLEGTEAPKVPVDVAATGPRVIAAGARLAERVTFTLGAEPERIRWGIEVARRARGDAGLDPGALSLGAYVNVGCDPDVAAACDLVRGSTGIFAHFLSMSGDRPKAVDADDRQVVEQLARSYDEAKHGLRTASHTALLTDEFVERFAVVGPPERCVERLSELLACGLDRLVYVPGSPDADPARVASGDELFAREALPRLRA